MGYGCGRFGRAGVMSVRPRLSGARHVARAGRWRARRRCLGKKTRGRRISPRPILPAHATARAQYAKCLDTWPTCRAQYK
jgi:hypothetical protein